MRNLALFAVIGLSMACGTVHAATMEELEQRIQELEASQLQQNQLSPFNLRVSGFVNVVGLATDQSSDAFYRNVGSVRVNRVDDKISFRGLSNAGLQLDAEINDKLSATVQMLGAGNEQFDMEFEWAYITYQVTDAFKMRAGKLVLPLNMMSQYKNVGYALPWAAVPSEVYGFAAANTFEGVDFTYDFNTGNINHSLNIVLGAIDIPLTINGGEIFSDDLRGINLASNFNNFSTWLSITRTNYTTTLAAAIGDANDIPGLEVYDLDDEVSDFYSIGVRYDDGRLLLIAEANRYEIPQNYYPDFEGANVTVGWQFGQYMPYVAWSKTDVEGWDDIEGPGGFFDLVTRQSFYTGQARHQKSWTFGVRADLVANLALKAEVSSYYDLGEPDQNFFVDADFNGEVGSFWEGLPDDEDNPMVFRVAANLVF